MKYRKLSVIHGYDANIGVGYVLNLIGEGAGPAVTLGFDEECLAICFMVCLPESWRLFAVVKPYLLNFLKRKAADVGAVASDAAQRRVVAQDKMQIFCKAYINFDNINAGMQGSSYAA